MKINTYRLLRGLLGLCLCLSPAADLPAKGPKTLRNATSLVYPDFWHTPMGVHRGTPTLLRMMLGDRVRFDDPQGVATTHLHENGEESPQVTVIGINSASGQVVYNPDMFSLDTYGREGHQVGEFYKPVGVAILPNGRVAVADAGNHRVVLLKMAKGKVRWTKSIGRFGKAPGLFDNPRWVAFDSLGRLYVSDTNNNRIQVFSEEGEYLYHFGDEAGAPNALVQPQALAVVDYYEPHSAKRTAGIYVIDQFHGRIQRFTLQGRFQAQVLPRQFKKYLVYFNALALDYFNNVWVVDRSNHQVHKFDRNLQYLDTWGSKGKEDYHFYSPRGIAIYRHYGQVFVLEKESAQYLWIGSDVKDLRLRRLRDEQGIPYLKIDFLLTEKSRVRGWVLNEDNKIVAGLTPGKRLIMRHGRRSLKWDGRGRNGQRVEDGLYKVVIEAEATYSSATYFRKRAVKRFYVR